MVHFSVLLALFVAGACLNRHQVHSDAVSHRSTPTADAERHPPPKITSTQYILNNTKAINVDTKQSMSFQDSIRVITTSDSNTQRDSATLPEDAKPGADAVRAAASSREWISSILDTVVMALLGLASIVVALILGRKQLRAIGVQLQLMLDIAQGHSRASRVEMDDLERGQHDSSLDRDRIEVRSEISSVDPAADPSNDVATTGAGAGFLPEPQLYVVDEDLLTQPVRDHEQASVQPRQLQCGDDFPHDGVKQPEDEGQTPEDTSTASSCSHLGRQDSNGLDLDGPKALHVDDPGMQAQPQITHGVDPAQQAISSGSTDSFPDT
ncbi:hypothetical protein Q7P36_005273 [Cladosporium allicinum]